MRKLLHSIDRRLLIAILAGVAVIGVSNEFFVRRTHSEIDSWRQMVTADTAKVGALKTKIDKLRASGTDSIETMFTYTQRLEKALSSEPDDLVVASKLSALAQQTNVKLSEFQVTSKEPVKVGGLSFTTYSFRLSGSREAALAWLKAVQGNTELVISLESVSVAVGNAEVRGGAVARDILSSDLTISGVMRVWALETPPLTLGADLDEQDAAAAGDDASTTGDTPASQPTTAP